MGIEINDLDLSIDDTPILHGISLTLTSGMAGIIGPNGAGKTTLLRAISGYLKPERGTVRLDGENVQSLSAKTGIGHLENRSVTGLSGGEWQRMIIARALCQQSSTLLLDEPVSSLDIKHQVGILSLVRELTGKQGMLCAAVLHDLNLARHYCDQIVLMKKGRVVACGKARDILVKDILEDVYDTKIRMVDAGGGDVYILPEME